MKHPDESDYVVGIVGAGAMGQGIIQVTVQGGMRTLILDARPGGAEAARKTISARLDRLVEKGRIGADDAAAAIARIEIAEDFADFAPCDAVIEAIFEEIEVTPIGRDDVVQLITKPIGGVFKIDQAVVDRIIELTDRKPYQVQRLCIALVNRMYEQGTRQITAADVDAVAGNNV